MIKKLIHKLCQYRFWGNFFYKLTGYKHLLKKYLPIYFTHKKNPEIVFLVYTPIHDNLGDHAIALAQIKLLDELGIKYIEITAPEIHKLREFKLLRFFNNSKVFINGGGNLGTLWFNVETMFRDIMLAAPKADILIFPSTIYYEDTDFGTEEFKKSKTIYNNHPSLTLYARENISYKIMKKAYKNVKLVPDMVFSLNKCEKNTIREGAVLCLRKDIEKTLTDEQEKIIFSQAEQLFGNNITKTDMCICRTITGEDRNSELDKKFAQFRNAQLVITDRLHCMIFCAVTGTPCIVVDSKSPKVKGCYEWIKHLEYIKFVDDVSKITDTFRSIPKKEFQYDNTSLQPYYDILKTDIKNILR